MAEIDHIEIVPDKFGWSVRVYTNGVNFEKHDISDAMQWVHETERTLGKWLADGPADFHNEQIGTDDAEAVRLIGEAALKCADGIKRAIDPDLVRDIERGK